jgi:hypothetical protein
MQDSEGESSTLQLVVDQVEELIVTLIEEIRARPAVAAALLAAVAGAMVGSALAARARHAPPAPRRVVRQARVMAELADLGGLGLRLLENPLVRAVLINQLRKRLFR